MNLIIDFYKGLDTINLILFWGIIIVVLLLLIFSIIIANKNKKLKRIIESQDQEIEESRNELAIKTEQINITNQNIENNIVNKTAEDNHFEEFPILEETNEVEEEELDGFPVLEEEPEETTQINEEINKEKNVEITEEKEFKAEEHVIEYNKNNTENNNINIINKKAEIIMPTAPYQKNVLREMSLSQTSPIGIVRKKENKEKEKAQELNESLQTVEKIEEITTKDAYENNYQKEMNNSKEKINKLYENNQKEEIKKENNYLKEVSEKLSEATKKDEIKRTEYEIKQEEDAIISYEELMQKKDSLKMIDEEDAVISIDELIEKKNQKERLYNITKEEENDEFISELKHFRSDL